MGAVISLQGPLIMTFTVQGVGADRRGRARSVVASSDDLGGFSVPNPNRPLVSSEECVR